MAYGWREQRRTRGVDGVRADPSLEIVRASHVEEYGKDRRAPVDAIVDFQGEDPGPLLRYTIVKPQNQQLREWVSFLRTPSLVAGAQPVS